MIPLNKAMIGQLCPSITICRMYCSLTWHNSVIIMIITLLHIITVHQED
jgi:hypothetical protein